MDNLLIVVYKEMFDVYGLLKMLDRLAFGGVIMCNVINPPLESEKPFYGKIPGDLKPYG